MYSRFGYNRQICQGRLLYLHSTNILYTRQNRLFIKSQSLEASKIKENNKNFEKVWSVWSSIINPYLL